MVNGKRHQFRYTNVTEAEANRRLADAVDDLLEGRSVQAIRRDARSLPTLASVIKDHIADLEAQGKGIAVDRGQRLSAPPRGYVAQRILDLRIDQVKREHIKECLRTCAETGKAERTVRHLLSDLSRVFTLLVDQYRDSHGLIDPTDGLTIDMAVKMSKQAKKVRAVLTDDELDVYLRWSHPAEHHRHGLVERQTMVVLSRCLGGLRAGDLHGLQWGADLDPTRDFPTCWALREKTKARQLFVMPHPLRRLVRAWWLIQDKPTTGVVFGNRRGERLGERKVRASHARALRRDLDRAFKLAHRQARARGETHDPRAPLPKSSRWVELFVGNERSLPVDFHSTRRAFAGALDMTSQEDTAEAVDLTGHSGLDVHRRYIRHLALNAREIPAEVLPTFDVIPDGYRAIFQDEELDWSLVDEPAGKVETSTEILSDEDLQDDLGKPSGKTGGKTGGSGGGGQKAKAPGFPGLSQLRGKDLNLRPSGYESGKKRSYVKHSKRLAKSTPEEAPSGSTGFPQASGVVLPEGVAKPGSSYDPAVDLSMLTVDQAPGVIQGLLAGGHLEEAQRVLTWLSSRLNVRQS